MKLNSIAFLLASVPLVSAFVAPIRTPSSTSSVTEVQSTMTSEEVKEKFETVKPALSRDLNPVAAGGWHSLRQSIANPKDDLVNLIVDGLKGESNKKIEFQVNNEKVEGLVSVLYGMGRGFEADVVDGDWSLVFTKQGTKSPKFQKLVGKGEKAGNTLNTFDVDTMTFTADAKVLKKGVIGSKVQYTTLTDGYSKTVDDKIVLRRIGCDIVGASWKFWFFPKIPLPLRVKGGYLEFVYMDNDIRVTRGNRGGLFVHFRPEFLEAQLSH